MNIIINQNIELSIKNKMLENKKKLKRLMTISHSRQHEISLLRFLGVFLEFNSWMHYLYILGELNYIRFPIHHFLFDNIENHAW